MPNAPRTVKDVPAQEFVVALAQYFRSTVRLVTGGVGRRGKKKLESSGREWMRWVCVSCDASLPVVEGLGGARDVYWAVSSWIERHSIAS
jgi:hypothetical protein